MFHDIQKLENGFRNLGFQNAPKVCFRQLLRLPVIRTKQCKKKKFATWRRRTQEMGEEVTLSSSPRLKLLSLSFVNKMCTPPYGWSW